MGVSNKDSTCKTCGLGLNDCIGHFGYVDLILPVFHVGHFRSTINILQTICKSCARVMIKDKDRGNYEYKLLNPHLSYLVKKALRQEIHSKAKKLSRCPFCHVLNGSVKKGPGLLRIVHNNIKDKRDITEDGMEINMDISGCRSARTKNRSDDIMHTEKISEELNPLAVLELFKMIPERDLPLLCMNSKFSKPSDLLVTKIFVPPVCIRPSVVSEFKSGT